MSYEGYEVKYCSNGHKKEVVDALAGMYGDETVKPCFCGSDEEYWDSVNETNGCECEYLSDEERAKGVKCGAHEKVPQKPIGYTMVKCKECNGSGMVMDVVEEKCCGKIDCELCFGTGTKYTPSSCNIFRRCPICLGRGTEPVPKYDISVLKIRHK
jgi:hypothetical protein